MLIIGGSFNSGAERDEVVRSSEQAASPSTPHAVRSLRALEGPQAEYQGCHHHARHRSIAGMEFVICSKAPPGL